MTFNHGDRFMWLFDAREFIGEIHVNHRHHFVSVMKVGGGTRGRRYDGSWLYRVVDTRNGRELSRGQIDSDIPVTHEELATVVNAQYMADRWFDGPMVTTHHNGHTYGS